MKLSFRRSITAVVLTLAAAAGVTAGTVAPASAASCTGIGHLYGSSRNVYSRSLGANTLEVSPNLDLTTTGDCSMFTYRYTVYIYKSNGTILAQQTQNGAWSGQVSFGAINVGVLPSGTSSIGIGFKTEFYYWGDSSWHTSQKEGWGVKVPGYSYNSSTGTNMVGGGCNATRDPNATYALGYSEWCKLPF